MSPRQILFGLAAALVVVGLVLGFRNVSSKGLSCGSAFSPSSSDAEQADRGEELGGTLSGGTPDADSSNNADACRDAVSDAKPLAYGATGLGALALIAGFVASPSRPTNADGSAKPSIWR